MSSLLTQRKSCEAEFKIIIFFTYILVYLLVVLCQDAIIIAWQESFTNVTKSYFLCEAVGHVPGRCSREPIEQYSHVISLMNCIYYIMTAFTPIIHLMLVTNFRIAKEGFLRMKIIQSFKTSSMKSSLHSSQQQNQQNIPKDHTV